MRSTVQRTMISSVLIVIMLALTTTALPYVMGEEFRDIQMDLQHSPFENPTDLINVGADYSGQTILTYQQWLEDYRSVGLDMPQGSYVGSFFAESLLKFDYTPPKYQSWEGQHSFLIISKNFKFTYEQIMNGATKWTVRLPILADSILPQGFPSILDNYDVNNWNISQEYVVDMLKTYAPKFAIWQTTGVNVNVSFQKSPDLSNVSFTYQDLMTTTTPLYLLEGSTYRSPDAMCNIYMEPDQNSSKYYVLLDEDNNAYISEDYHNDTNIKGYMSNARIINDRIYIDMNYPIKPEINYTMSFICRLKSNPEIYFTEEDIGGTSFTQIDIIELGVPLNASDPKNIVGDFRDVLNTYDSIFSPFFVEVYLNFSYEEYNKSIPISSGWDIIFEEGYGNGLFGVQKEVHPGDMLAFRPYVQETEDNSSLKHLSMMLPFISKDNLNPDVFVTYGNDVNNNMTNMIPYQNGKYRWFSSDAAMLDYDNDGILNYKDPSTSMLAYGYNRTLSFYNFYGENPYFYSRLDSNYDGYVDFDWNDLNNNNSGEYLITSNYTKPYYRPVTAWNASNEIIIFNTTETLNVNLSVYNEGSFYCNITVMNHEKLITADKIGPLGTYTYSGPATVIVFWRGDGLNHGIPGGWNGTWLDMGNSGSYVDEYGNSVTCRNCLWLNYTLNFWSTNPSAFKWLTNGSVGSDTPLPSEVWKFHLSGVYRDLFYDINKFINLSWGAPVFILDYETGPIGDYSKPFPWEPTSAPPGTMLADPIADYNQYDDYDNLFKYIKSIKVYDSTGRQYYDKFNYDMKITRWYLSSKYYEAFFFKNINISSTADIFIEMQLPMGYQVFSGIVEGTHVSADLKSPDGQCFFSIVNETDYLSMIERPLYAGTDGEGGNLHQLNLVGQAWNNPVTTASKNSDSYHHNLSWIYPGVAPTKMSDSDGINASDYLLFSTRNTFIQRPYATYLDFFGDPDVISDAYDRYKEDGFVVYVIFRETANITFLCYDPTGTDMKNTDLTNKFYFIRGQSSDWFANEGNEYLTDPTWRVFHVSNNFFSPYNYSASWYKHLLWNDQLDANAIISDTWVRERVDSGEIWDANKEFYNKPYLTLTGRGGYYTSATDPSYIDYYVPIQTQQRLSTEVYYFSIFNSASLTDGEWTQVLVRPEYVWTSVPRFNTEINIGNFFITVNIPQGTTTIDAFAGLHIKDFLKFAAAMIIFGLPGFALALTKAMKDILKNIADQIWNGMKHLYDGASNIPGWLMGAFSTLVEKIREFGEWIKQVLLEFYGIVKNLIEELLNFIDFALQYVLFVFPFVGFMLVINYYEMFLVKVRLAIRNVFIKNKTEEFPDD